MIAGYQNKWKCQPARPTTVDACVFRLCRWDTCRTKEDNGGQGAHFSLQDSHAARKQTMLHMMFDPFLNPIYCSRQSPSSARRIIVTKYLREGSIDIRDFLSYRRG